MGNEEEDPFEKLNSIVAQSENKMDKLDKPNQSDVQPVQLPQEKKEPQVDSQVVETPQQPLMFPQKIPALPQQQFLPEKKKVNVKKILIIGLIVLGLIILIGLVYYFFTSDFYKQEGFNSLDEKIPEPTDIPSLEAGEILEPTDVPPI